MTDCRNLQSPEVLPWNDSMQAGRTTSLRPAQQCPRCREGFGTWTERAPSATLHSGCPAQSTTFQASAPDYRYDAAGKYVSRRFFFCPVTLAARQRPVQPCVSCPALAISPANESSSRTRAILRRMQCLVAMPSPVQRLSLPLAPRPAPSTPLMEIKVTQEIRTMPFTAIVNGNAQRRYNEYDCAHNHTEPGCVHASLLRYSKMAAFVRGRRAPSI